jgi:hypothetical protein
VGHVYLAFELGLFGEVRQAGTMVDVEVCHEQNFDVCGVNLVKVGQRLDALAARMHAAVKHNLAALKLQVDAGPTNLAAGAQRRDL